MAVWDGTWASQEQLQDWSFPGRLVTFNPALQSAPGRGLILSVPES